MKKFKYIIILKIKKNKIINCNQIYIIQNKINKGKFLIFYKMNKMKLLQLIF